MQLPVPAIPIIIDGPNYINRLLELGIAAPHLARQLHIRGLMSVIDQRLADIPGISGSCGSAELVCSRKRFGSESKKFTVEQQTQLLNRMRAEVGVYVDVIDIPGTSEKGVDTTIASRLRDLEGEVPAAVLVSADRDYIPILRKLRHTLKVILFSVSDFPPVELQNEAYGTIVLGEDYRSLFRYHYPRFRIQDLDEAKLSELFSEADDRRTNQLRVDHDGEVYLDIQSRDSLFLDHVKFRFESYGLYNGYVGPKVASDQTYVGRALKQLRLAWQHEITGYIDYPVEAMIQSRGRTA